MDTKEPKIIKEIQLDSSDFDILTEPDANNQNSNKNPIFNNQDRIEHESKNDLDPVELLNEDADILTDQPD